MSPRTLLPRFSREPFILDTVMDTPATHSAVPAGRPSCCRSSPCSCCRSRPAPRFSPMKAARAAGATPTGPRPAACRRRARIREARVLVMSGRTGGWKGVFSVHSWVVLKPENAQELAALRRGRLGQSGADQRLGAGRAAGTATSRRWCSTCAARTPPSAIPKIEAAVKAYQIRQCRRLPHLARAEQQHLRRHGAARHPGGRSDPAGRTRSAATSARCPMSGLTDSRTGVEASLWGMLGVKLGWVEGVEMNFLGLVAGLDLRNPGVKLPGFGRIGLPQQTATRDAPKRCFTANCRAGQPGDGGDCRAASARLPRMHDTLPLLEKIPFPAIRRGRLDTLQINVGYRCNQSCVHCHVGAEPAPHRGDGRRGRRHRAGLPGAPAHRHARHHRRRARAQSAFPPDGDAPRARWACA